MHRKPDIFFFENIHVEPHYHSFQTTKQLFLLLLVGLLLSSPNNNVAKMHVCLQKY